LVSTFQSGIFPVLDLRGEAFPVVHETWNYAEFYGNHRYLDWTGLEKEKEVNKNKYREIKVYRRRRLIGKELENALRF